MDGGGLALGHHGPLAQMHLNFQVAEGVAGGESGRVAGVGLSEAAGLVQVGLVVLVGVVQIPGIEQAGQGQGQGIGRKFLRGQQGQAVLHRIVGQDGVHHVPPAAGVVQDQGAVLLGDVTAGEEVPEERLVHGVDGRGGQDVPPRAGHGGVGEQEGAETLGAVFAVDVHQGLGAAEQVVGPAGVILHVGLDAGQVVASLGVVAHNGFAGQGHRAGDLEEVVEHAVLGVFQVVGGDLAGHIHGDVALQAQHHLGEGAVQIVDDVEVEALFQQGGHAEHPLFGEVRVPGHLGHGHIAVENDRVGGAGEGGGLEKVQLRVHHGPQAGDGAAGGELEGQGGDLQLVEADGADILVQVELVQLGEKRGYIVLRAAMTVQQPGLDALAALLRVGDALRGAVQQLGQDGAAVRVVDLGGHVVGYGSGELHRLGGLACAAAEAEQGGGIVVGVLAQAGDAETENGHQSVEILPQALFVHGVAVLTGEKRSAHVLGGEALGLGGDGLTQTGEGLTVEVGNAAAAAVAAEGGGGDAGGGAQLLGGAAQGGDVFIQLVTKAHGGVLPDGI